MAKGSSISYGPALSKWQALFRGSTWTFLTSLFALFPILYPGISYAMTGQPEFKLNDYFQNGAVLIFALGLLGGLAMDYVHEPRKDKLKIEIWDNQVKDCRGLFICLFIVGFIATIITTMVVLNHPGKITPEGITIEWCIICYAAIVALILKFVVFACA